MGYYVSFDPQPPRASKILTYEHDGALKTSRHNSGEQRHLYSEWGSWIQIQMNIHHEKTITYDLIDLGLCFAP